MIYEAVSPAEPLLQGDIFRSLPSVRTSLRDMLRATNEGDELVQWTDVADVAEPSHFLFETAPVPSIVLTPDCDALRAEFIVLAEIRPFAAVEGKAKTASSPKSFMRIITQHARLNQKWFYLPPHEIPRFAERMAVDFRAVVSVPREDLEGLRALRVARLRSPAIEHFRERLSEFFRRYPYNEWYPLNREEFDEYIKDKGREEIRPYPWQVADDKPSDD